MFKMRELSCGPLEFKGIIGNLIINKEEIVDTGFKSRN